MKITDRLKKGIVYITAPLLLVLSVFSYSIPSLAAETDLKEVPLFAYDIARNDPLYIDFTTSQIETAVSNLKTRYNASDDYSNIILGFNSDGNLYVYIGVNNIIMPAINSSYPSYFISSDKGNLVVDIDKMYSFNDYYVNGYTFPYANYKSWYYGYYDFNDGRFWYSGSTNSVAFSVNTHVYPYNFDAYTNSTYNNQMFYVSYSSGSGSSSPATQLGFGDLDFLGHSDGFSNDMFNSIAQGTYQVFGTNYHSYYSSTDILNASDIFDALKMIMENVFRAIQNLGVLLNKILLSMMWFFDDILQFIRNFWNNLKLLFINAINLLVGTFDKDPDTESYFTWVDDALTKFFSNGNENNPFYRFWRFSNSLYDFGLDNGEFSFITFLRRIFVPDDFGIDKITNRFHTEFNVVTGLPAQFIDIYYQCFNNITEGIVPSFHVSSFRIMETEVPAVDISLVFLVPYLPTIKAFIAVWAWLTFIVYFIRTLPTIIAGAGFTEVDVEPEHRKIGF